MTHVLTVAARDLRERMFVFITAAVLAVMPFAVALVPGIDRGKVILIGGFLASVNLTIGVALVVGATMIGRDLFDHRLSFYFSKPISAPAIWFGKLLGAIVTVALTFAIGFGPTYLAAGSAWQSFFSGPVRPLAAGILLGAFSLVLVAHGLSTIVRSHSPLAALDLILLCAAVIGIWLLVVPLFANFAFGVAVTIIKIALAAVPTTLVFAGAWQLSRGRTDIRSSHLELSRFFWMAMAITIAILGGYVAWVFSAGPKDLRNTYAVSSPRGDWFFVNGVAWHRGDYAPTFLVNATNAKWTRTRAWRWGGIQFTPRGDAAIVLSTRVNRFSIAPLADICVQRLDGRSGMIDTEISIPFTAPVVVLSDDLRRIAKFENHSVSVHDIASKTLLGSARIPFGEDASMFFLTPSVVRVYAAPGKRDNTREVPGEVRIYEFNVETKQLQQTGRVAASFPVQVSADGSSAVLYSGGSVIADARSGAVRTILPAGKRASMATILPNGWIAVVDAPKGVVIRLFDSQGVPLREIPITAAAGRMFTAGRVVGLVSGGKLLVTIRHTPGTPNSDLCVVDPQRGTIERIEKNVRLGTQRWSSDPRVSDVTPSQVVIEDRLGTIWRWNPLTGAKTKIL